MPAGPVLIEDEVECIVGRWGTQAWSEIVLCSWLKNICQILWTPAGMCTVHQARFLFKRNRLRCVWMETGLQYAQLEFDSPGSATDFNIVSPCWLSCSYGVNVRRLSRARKMRWIDVVQCCCSGELLTSTAAIISTACSTSSTPSRHRGSSLTASCGREKPTSSTGACSHGRAPMCVQHWLMSPASWLPSNGKDCRFRN